MQSLVVLLGAGASIPAGMPSTEDITDRVRSGDEVYLHTDDTYYLGNESDTTYMPRNEYVPRITEAIDIIGNLIREYFESHLRRTPNYEDIYYYAQQLEDCLTGEYDNPAVYPAHQEFRKLTESIIAPREHDLGSWSHNMLLTQTRNYITDVTWRLLNKEPNATDHLRFIGDAISDSSFDHVSIYTLNHDVCVESFLDEQGISFVDGFGPSINGVRYWESDCFVSDDAHVGLYKLHGSIDWYALIPNEGSDQPYRVGRISADDIAHTLNPMGQHQTTYQGRPIILAGTHNKILRYQQSEVFTELHCHFYRELKAARKIVVCGYGFGDKGINGRIVEWMDSSTQRHLAIVHPDFEELMKWARPAISRRIGDWLKGGHVHVHPHRIEDANWEAIRRSLVVN